ncbi:hypothetical protein [Streptomyces sp. NPDC056160]|uniref:hypothetical protein n=1 Tax=Streptomyces sp. NPDC056160 TaxID=3345731 RepID=UPI0035DC888A
MAQAGAANLGMGVLHGIDTHGFNGVLVRLTIPPLWLGLRADTASPFLVQIASELDDQCPDTTTWQFWNGEQWLALHVPDIAS